MQFSLLASVRAAVELPYIAKGRKVIVAHALHEGEAETRVTGQESCAWKRAGHGMGWENNTSQEKAGQKRKGRCQ